MIKILKIFFVSLILIFFVSLTYLSIFGIETNRFNKLISDKIRNIHPEIDVKLKKIKLTIELFELKVLIVTKNPVIEISNKKLNLKKVSTAYNIKSFFKKDFGITNLNFTTDYNEVKNIIKFARAFKDSPQLLIIDKVSKSGKLNINARFKINQKGQIENNYLITGEVKDYSLKLFNNDEIKKINFKFKYKEKNTSLTDVNLDYKNLAISSNDLQLIKINNIYKISGNIKNSKSKIDQELYSNYIKNINFKNLILSSDSNFSFEVDKKLKFKNFNLKSNIDIESAEYHTNNKIFKEILPNLTNKIDIKKNKISLEYGNGFKISGRGEIFISEKKENIEYEIENFKNRSKVDLNLSLNQNPLKFSLLNFYKNEDVKCQLNIKLNKNKQNIIIENLSITSEKNKFNVNNLKINNNNKISDFKSIKLKYEDKDKIKNDLIITKNKKTYLVEGNNFSLNSIINDTLTGDKKKNVEFFDNQRRLFNIKFDQNDIDKDHVINDLSGEIVLIGSKINALNLNSKFKKNQKVSLSILTKNNEQVTTFYSDLAKPFVKKFNFIKGFEEGKINFSSSKINNTSSSQLNIYDFKLKELPALTKLLTLASLQGIADILTGEGVRFNEFEMIFTNKDDKMTIDEIYSIGPAISILMEGYVQKNKLVSLKGTLVPATTINKFVSSIPILGNILVGKKTGEGVFGVSFKIKGPPKNLKTTVNPIKTLTPRFITRTLEKIKNTN